MTYNLAGPDFSLNWLTSGDTQMTDFQTSSGSGTGGDVVVAQSGSRERSDLNQMSVVVTGAQPYEQMNTDHWLENYDLAWINGALQGGGSYSLAQQHGQSSSEQTEFNGNFGIGDYLMAPYQFAGGLGYVTNAAQGYYGGSYNRDGVVAAAGSAYGDAIPTGTQFEEGEEYKTVTWYDQDGFYHVSKEDPGGNWWETVYEDDTMSVILEEFSGTMAPSALSYTGDGKIAPEEADRNLHPATQAVPADARTAPPDPNDPAVLEKSNGLSDQYGELEEEVVADDRAAQRTNYAGVGTPGNTFGYIEPDMDRARWRIQQVEVRKRQLGGWSTPSNDTGTQVPQVARPDMLNRVTIDGMSRNDFVVKKIYPLMAVIQNLQRRIDATNDPNLKQAFLNDQQMYKNMLAGEYAKLGISPSDGDPVAAMSFIEKLGAAIQKAIESGELTGEALAQLQEMVKPENLALMAGVIAGYATLHGTPAAPFLAVGDAYFLASGGTQTALGLQKIYLAVNDATTEWELDDAASAIVEAASGPLADAMFSFALFGAGKVGKLLKTKFKKADVPSQAVESAERAIESTRPKTVGDGFTYSESGKVRWVEENVSMSKSAHDYDDGAIGARSNPVTQRRLVPSIERTLPDGTKVPVKFDGIDGDVLIDRKRSITTFPKSKDQALRQSQALKENGLTGRWEVPNEAQARRARKMLEDLGITNISVKVVP